MEPHLLGQFPWDYTMSVCMCVRGVAYGSHRTPSGVIPKMSCFVLFLRPSLALAWDSLITFDCLANEPQEMG